MTRPRLLFLSHCLPFPVDEGVKIRTFHILKLLSREYEVTALCFYRSAGHRTLESVTNAVRALSEFGDVQAFPIPQEHSRARLLWDHARSVATQRAYTHFAYASKAYQSALNRALAEHPPSIVHVDSLDLTYYLDRLPTTIPVALGHHNVESALLERRSLAAHGLRRWYLKIQSRLTETTERFWLPKVALNLAVSDADLSALRAIAPDCQLGVVSNGVDTGRVEALPDADDGIVFVGGATWFPNRDALHYFTAEILPHVRAMRPRTRVTWVGQCTQRDKDEMKQRYDVDLTGYVDEIESYVSKAGCYIVPLRVGGGTRLKILYAWSMARAVVSTSIGCEGLLAVDGENIIVRNDALGFARAIVDVLDNATIRKNIRMGARRTAEEHYDWEVIGRPMLEKYREMLAQSQ